MSALCAQGWGLTCLWWSNWVLCRYSKILVETLIEERIKSSCQVLKNKQMEHNKKEKKEKKRMPFLKSII